MTTVSITLQLGDVAQMRAYLDKLNEAGQDDRCVGIDAVGQPFLACLAGIYADSARVLTCDPDDIERDQGPHCDACGQATDRDDLDVLNYPVTVLVKVPE